MIDFMIVIIQTLVIIYLWYKASQQQNHIIDLEDYLDILRELHRSSNQLRDYADCSDENSDILNEFKHCVPSGWTLEDEVYSEDVAALDLWTLDDEVTLRR